MGAAVFASADYSLTSTYTYSLTADVGTSYIRDLEFTMDGGYAGDPNSGWGQSTSFFNNLQSDGSQSSNSGTLSSTDSFFPAGSSEPFLKESMFFGIMQGLPQDVLDGNADQKHLVLFMDPTSAANVQNRAFGSVFPTTSEDDLISAIEYVHDDSHSDAAKAPYYDNVIHPFYDAARDALAGANPTPQRSVYIGPNSPFSIVIFSNGQTIGSGTGSVSVVPEPASLAALGVGAMGLLRRRRNRA